MIYKIPFKIRPRLFADGEIFCEIPKSLFDKDDEVALALRLIGNRSLFGLMYRTVMPEYFDSMPKNSGVLISPFVPTHNIIPNVRFPGDIDLLIIPYEENELILSKTLVMELKVIRAKYVKQSRSPNQFGFKQANGLLTLGFPYVAIGHLIVSDDSPYDAWENVNIVKVLNSESGLCSDIFIKKYDMMPINLISRSYGRLKSNCKNDILGLTSVYISERELCYPQGIAAKVNANISLELMQNIANYYENNINSFLLTKR